MFILPNGIDLNRVRESAGRPVFEQKENLILTIGRIGTEQKNNELLLKALADIKLKDWSVQFVGPIEESFKSKIDLFLKIILKRKKKYILSEKLINERRFSVCIKRQRCFA